MLGSPAPEWCGAVVIIKMREPAEFLPWRLRQRTDAGQPIINSREDVKAGRLPWKHMKGLVSCLCRTACEKG